MNFLNLESGTEKLQSPTFLFKTCRAKSMDYRKADLFLNSKQHVAKTQNGIQGLCFAKTDHPNQLAESFKCFISHHLFPEVKVFSDIPPADVHFWDDAACLKGLQELDIDEDRSKD